MQNDPEPKEVIEIEDSAIGLALQFIVATMLAQGLSEVTLSKSVLDQAWRKLVQATKNEDGGFTVRISR